MSHFTSIKTKLVSGPHIAKALKAMGYENVEVFDTPQHMFGFTGSNIKKRAEIIIRKRDLKIRNALADVGFCKNEEGSYDWIITNEERRRLSENWYDELSQRYSYYIVLDSLEKQGFSQVETERQPDQSIRIVMRRMV